MVATTRPRFQIMFTEVVVISDPSANIIITSEDEETSEIPLGDGEQVELRDTSLFLQTAQGLRDRQTYSIMIPPDALDDTATYAHVPNVYTPWKFAGLENYRATVRTLVPTTLVAHLAGRHEQDPKLIPGEPQEYFMDATNEFRPRDPPDPISQYNITLDTTRVSVVVKKANQPCAAPVEKSHIELPPEGPFLVSGLRIQDDEFGDLEVNITTRHGSFSVLGLAWSIHGPRLYRSRPFARVPLVELVLPPDPWSSSSSGRVFSVQASLVQINAVLQNLSYSFSEVHVPVPVDITVIDGLFRPVKRLFFLPSSAPWTIEVDQDLRADADVWGTPRRFRVHGKLQWEKMVAKSTCGDMSVPDEVSLSVLAQNRTLEIRGSENELTKAVENLLWRPMLLFVVLRCPAACGDRVGGCQVCGRRPVHSVGRPDSPQRGDCRRGRASRAAGLLRGRWAGLWRGRATGY